MQINKAVPRRSVALGLVAPLALLGCYVKVDKSHEANGDKDVEVHTPLGGVHVAEHTPSAADMGLPTYPGATLAAKDGKDDKDAADVNLGFGEWQLRVSVAKYQTTDARAKVESFYRSALGRYGDVIECRNGQAVGTPSVTRDGLGCDNKHNKSTVMSVGDDEMDYNLRAGSPKHQHIVGFADHNTSGTRFALVRLDLPGAVEQKDKEE